MQTSTLRWLSALLLLVATGAPAQERDAFVLPFGTVRLVAGAEFSRHAALFGDGAAATLPTGILEPLTSARFAPLAAIEPELTAFFAATGGAAGAQPVAVSPETFLLGTLGSGATVSQRVAPVGLRIGLLPRVEVGASVPVVRGELLVAEVAPFGATLGVNPRPAENAALLGRIGSRWRTLGSAGFLPTDSSTLGRELQRRVLALTGSRIALPASPVQYDELQEVLASELSLPRFASRNTPWTLGDVEVDARVQLVNTLGRDAYPRNSSESHLRVSVGAGLRLPTGVRPDTVQLVDPLPEVGLTGGRVGVAADLFTAGRLWLSAGGTLSVFRPVQVERRLTDPTAPFARRSEVRSVRWTPGRRFEGWLAPRVRLEEGVSLAGEYLLESHAASTVALLADAEAPSRLESEQWTAHSIGLTARYSTLPAYAARRARLAVEAEIGYRRAIAGSTRAPRASGVTLQISLLQSLWGGAPRQ